MDSKIDELTNLFLEFSSINRYMILSKLDEKNSKQSKIAAELDMTLPESHRQFERLANIGLISKNANNVYQITPFGKIILQQIQSIWFLLRFKEYFLTHSLGDLPQKFVKRISDLNYCDFIEGAFVINEKMKEIASEGKYLKVISSHVPPDAFRKGLTATKKTQKNVSIVYAKDTIIPKGFKKEFTNTIVQKLISHGTYERRMINQVQIYIVLNDVQGLILFPDIKGNVDLSCGFLSDDKQFHGWCFDYHQYIWNKSRPFMASSLKESR